MKHLLFLALIALIFTNCNDGLELPGSDNPVNLVPENVPIDNPSIDPDDVVVHFSDTVVDENMVAIAGAQVSIYAENCRFSDLTDSNGKYHITVPLRKLPATGFMSLSIVKQDYLPENVTYPAPLTANTTYDSQQETLALTGCPTCLDVGGYKSSELFHLGDDNYNGAANSQFQKATDGVEVQFELAGAENYSKLKLSFEAKGLQISRFENPSSVQFSSGAEMTVEEFIGEDSAEDGGYTAYSIVIANNQATNGIKFLTRNHGTEGSDYDDWEFTCLYVQGVE